MFGFSQTPSLEKLREDHKTFNYDKMKWDDYQTPRSLFLALIGELGELVADVINTDFEEVVSNSDAKKDEEESEANEDGEKCEDEKEDTSKYEAVLSELVDVLSYLICLAHECVVDIASPHIAGLPSLSEFKFSDTTWDELEVTAFYMVNRPQHSSVLQDVFRLTFSASNLCDIIQWISIDKAMVNLSSAKRKNADKVLKDIFCHIVSISSKYQYDLPRLLQEKNTRTAEKYSDCVGILSKETVISERYSSLPAFRTTSTSHAVFKLNTKITDPDITVERMISCLIKSIGLISELLQWDAEGHEISYSDPKHAHLSHQLAIVVHSILQLAIHHKISLSQAFAKKMEKNNAKYPAEMVRGAMEKYDEYYQKDQKTGKNNSDLENAQKCHEDNLSVEDASRIMEKFVVDRDWTKYHTPRNLTLALFGEIGEVIELFIGTSPTPDVERLGDELSDCLAYTVRLAKQTGVDLSAALLHYFPVP